MKITLWVTNSGVPLEHEVADDDTEAVEAWDIVFKNLTEITGQFLSFGDGETVAHLVAVDKIDVIKVETS